MRREIAFGKGDAHACQKHSCAIAGNGLATLCRPTSTPESMNLMDPEVFDNVTDQRIIDFAMPRNRLLLASVRVVPDIVSVSTLQ